MYETRNKKDLDGNPGRPPSSATLDAKGKGREEGAGITGGVPVTRGSSKEGHRVDALALRAEERRDKLRKAAGAANEP